MTFEHHQMGSVHVVTPLGPPGAALEASAHELETCHAPAVLVDLTRLEDFDPARLETLVIALEHPELDHHWRLQVSPRDRCSFFAELERLGFDATRLITG